MENCQPNNDDDILHDVALGNLRGLAEILEDLPLPLLRHDDIKDSLKTISYVIKKGLAGCQTVEQLRNAIREKDSICQEKFVLLEARIVSLTSSIEEKDKLINNLQEEVVALSEKKKT